jgi:hypothetical protein
MMGLKGWLKVHGPRQDGHSILGWLGSHSIRASLCAVGTDKWIDVALLDVSQTDLWIVANANLPAARTFLCIAHLPDRELKLVVMRTEEALKFTLVPGSLLGARDLLAHAPELQKAG